MGSSDIAPPTAPTWLVDASTVSLGTGVVFWLAAYVLMVRRSLATKDTPAPLLALALNLSWEVVYVFGVCEELLEYCGFAMWLLLDIPVLYVTLKTAPRSFASSPLIARNIPLLLGVMFIVGFLGNAGFVWWWLKEPHRGHGYKWGKKWKGLEGRDTTELAFWSAGVAQTIFSVSALAMLLQRGHSGGQSYGIWFCRSVGTVMGLFVNTILLWWYWPEAHSFVSNPLGIFLIGSAALCDVIYPFVLYRVRLTEKVLPDGTIISGEAVDDAAEKKQK